MEDILEAIFRVILEVIFEILIKGPGYLIIKLFRSRSRPQVDPDGYLVVVVGLLFWLVVIASLWAVFAWA